MGWGGGWGWQPCIIRCITLHLHYITLHCITLHYIMYVTLHYIHTCVCEACARCMFDHSMLCSYKRHAHKLTSRHMTKRYTRHHSRSFPVLLALELYISGLANYHPPLERAPCRGLAEVRLEKGSRGFLWSCRCQVGCWDSDLKGLGSLGFGFKLGCWRGWSAANPGAKPNPTLALTWLCLWKHRPELLPT